MRFQFVDRGWESEFRKALKDSNGFVRIICPFIQSWPVQLLLGGGRPNRFEVITCYNLDDFASGVSDPSALRTLLEHGAHIRGIRGLHAKLYVIGDCAMVTSANLTEKGLHDNHEFGIITRDPLDVLECNRYFEILWHRVGQKDLTLEKVGEWESVLLAYKGGVAAGAKLGDEGAIVWPTGDEESPESEGSDVDVEFSPGEQAFVKFFGNDSTRVPTSLPQLILLEPMNQNLRMLAQEMAHTKLRIPRLSREPRPLARGRRGWRCLSPKREQVVGRKLNRRRAADLCFTATTG
jgi:hypothetical protein